MDKVDAVESLLPGFRDFLNDLTFVELPSDLKNKAKNFQQRLREHIDQHLTPPSVPLPAIPTSNPPIDIQRQREQAWRMSKMSDQNAYQNSQQDGDFYEEPMRDIPPALPPTNSRPPIPRVVDPVEDFYEEPEESGNSSGRGSMPISDEGSGGSFVFQRSGETISYYDSGEESTDYESMDDEMVEDKPTVEKQKKQKMNKQEKLEAFKKEHESEADIDLMDQLFYYNNVIGTMKVNTILGKWEKRYCIARDNQLLIYKSYKDKEKKPQRLPLMGYEVYIVGLQSNRDHVFRINHSSMKHPLLFATNSKIDTEKWAAVLQKYATIDHTIVPSSGYAADTNEEMDDGTHSKKGGFFWKKEKDNMQQIFLDEQDNLTGYVNILGARYGEQKVKRKWITISGTSFACAPSRDELNTFSFLMSGINVDNADKKEAKMKNAFKVSKDGEVLMYIEALNKVDTGTLLKKLVEIMEKKPEKAPSVPNPAPQRDMEATARKATEGIVAKLMANFESSPADQPDSVGQKHRMSHKSASLDETAPVYENSIHGIPVSPEDLYDDIDVTLPSSTPTKTTNLMKFATLPSKLRAGNKDKDPTPSLQDFASGEKKETDKERKAREKKEKKEREKEEKEREKEKKEKEKREKEKKKKEKEEKKRKEAEAAEAAAKEAEESAGSAPSIPSSPPPAIPSHAQPPSPSHTTEKKEEVKKSPTRRTSEMAKKLGDHSGTSHLILKDKLMQDRKDIEGKTTEASKRKAEIRVQMNNTTDPGAKAQLKVELDAAQKEWSDLSKSLGEISRQIEASTGKDVNDNTHTSRSSVRSPSPDREKVSVGTVSDRMKMFQGK